MPAKDSKAYYQANKLKIRAQVAEYYQANKEKRRAYLKQYQTESRKQSLVRLKHNVRSMVQGAVKRGHIVKLPCENCGSLKVEAHHDDYLKPLEIRWFCRKHHLEYHSK